MADGLARAEVVAALSLATDLAMGQPLETGLGICAVSLALAEQAGLDETDADRVYYVALLRHIGCTAENQQFSEFLGDEIEFHRGAAPLDATTPRGLAPFVLRSLVRTHGLIGAAAKLAQMMTSREAFDEGVRAVCEVAELLADRLGLDAEVGHDLTLANERWDGKSFLKRTREEGVPVSVRIAQVAETACVYHELGGPDAAAAAVGQRAGGAFDPRLARLFASDAATLCRSLGGDSLWETVVAAAPDAAPLPHGEADAALAAVAEFADLKSPFTVGHSAGVAELAAAAAEHAGLPASDAVALRRAGLVHDVGRVGIPSPIWEKRGPLSVDEWERVRLHPYLTERVLARGPALSELSALASLHHERCDGSGYHRGLDGRSLPPAARLLAAADAYRAMTEPRPHREALTADAAAEELRREARAGRLDGDAVEAVLTAAGQRPRRRREHVAGLTARELDVLRLLAGGLSTRQIASGLVIAPKTADAHIQHIYAKIGVSTRAAASVYAMRHGLVDAET
jgi:HD-GYP domain-containing protein (c-di-GMP phosphodiesterase class II)